jgi:S1-C subfamily serine protease
MFAMALEKVSVFTMPVIISKRFMDGKVESGCASFIIVNPEGWILTSAHVLNDVSEYVNEFETLPVRI